MDNTKPNSGDDAVTIPEALKRLGKKAPARQSFYAAVNKGKIREVTDKENPKAPRMVSWKTVLEFIAGGGFKPRKTSGAADEAAPKATPPMAERTTMDSPQEPITVSSALAKSPTTAKPKKPQGLYHSGNTSAKNQDAPCHEQARGNSLRKSNSAPPRECANPKVNMKSVASDKPKGRRHLPLRIIKNNLRHLDYEQTKAIRDWADNRLLTVLRPDSSVVTGNPETKTPQTA